MAERKSMTSSPLRDCHRSVFKVARSLSKSPHADEILVLGIDVGELHVEEQQDLHRANDTREAEREAEVDDSQVCVRLCECEGTWSLHFRSCC